jgi:hypothetical protein
MKEMNIGILVHVYDINEINYGMRLRKKEKEKDLRLILFNFSYIKSNY